MGSHWKALTVIIIIALLTLAYVPSSCLSENYGFSYQLIDYHDNSKHYRLNVAVPESLYEYYAGKNHQLITENDFAKFVTPYALKPIADSLLEIYSGNEDFANGALMIIHQIFYQAINPSRYPVETIAKNEGDCDLLSYVLASILKAAGLDSVLLYYEHESHMNVGVYLESPPQDPRGEVHYVIHDDKKYYTAECTGNNWQSGWRVGECPEELKHAGVQITTLENSEQAHTGQVSASYRTLAQTTLTLRTSTLWVVQGSVMSVEGELSPPLQGKNVTIYVKTNNLPWTVLGTAIIDSDGKFGFSWNVNAGGTCNFRASWSGNENLATADSPILTITSLSTFFVLFLAIIIIMIFIGAATYLSSRLSHQALTET